MLDLKMMCIIKTINLCNPCCSLEVKVWGINLANVSYFIFTLKTSFAVSEYIETQEVPSELQETVFYCEGDQALNSLPRELVESPSLMILKSHLDKLP